MSGAARRAWAGWAALASVLTVAGCDAPADAAPDRGTAGVLALSVASTGEVVLLERDTLTVRRRVVPAHPGAPAAPMHVLEDPARGCFYAGNFDGGLARIPAAGGPQRVLDLGGALIGLALSSDGRRLAVNGAHDLVLRLVDPDAWAVVACVSLGDPAEAPRHAHMTHGLASTHPLWLPDGSGVLTQDNIHEELVLVGRDGGLQTRRAMPCGVHALLPAGDGTVLALAEGTVDGTVAPRVVVLALPELRVVREVEVPLAPDEPAKLHHAALSPDGELLVVANMGPLHGERPGRSVVALRWRTGEVAWRADGPSHAGHVRFVDGGRVAVLGHSDADVVLLDARDGRPAGRWSVPGARSLGHALAHERGGTLLLLDAGAGRAVRLAEGGPVALSPPLGEGVMEAALPE